MSANYAVIFPILRISRNLIYLLISNEEILLLKIKSDRVTNKITHVIMS